MKFPRARFFAVLIGVLLVLPRAAWADSLSIAVTVTCDTTQNRALVRFGYGDAGETPYFATLNDPVYGNLSKRAVTLPGGPEQNEARCKMPDGREVRVIKKDRPPRFSVYVGKSQVIAKDRLFNNVGQGSASDTDLPFGVTVGPEGIRKCYFDLGEDDDVYNLIRQSPSLPSINCDRSDQ